MLINVPLGRFVGVAQNAMAALTTAGPPRRTARLRFLQCTPMGLIASPTSGPVHHCDAGVLRYVGHPFDRLLLCGGFQLKPTEGLKMTSIPPRVVTGTTKSPATNLRTMPGKFRQSYGRREFLLVFFY